MALMDWEPVSAHARMSEQECSKEGCHEQASVKDPYTSKWVPLCFRHAFISALSQDSQAMRLALGYAVGEGLRNAREENRRTG